MLEVIDIDADQIESTLKQASGIWIGDLAVMSPFQSNQFGVLGRHLMEQIKTSIRGYAGKIPIFCRSERKDIQEFLMSIGFVPLGGGNLSGKTVWLLPTIKQCSGLKRVTSRPGRRQATGHKNLKTAFQAQNALLDP